MSSPEELQQIQQYLLSLNEKEENAYRIANEHLGSSFSLEKSNGFLQWLKTQQQPSLLTQKPSPLPLPSSSSPSVP